jgi:E3 ubiquitin-protein ligase RNF31
MHEDLTDDEDSDLEMFTDDSRSRMKRNSYADIRSAGRRERRNTEQLDLDYRDTEVISRIQRMKEKSKHIRERRSGSLTNWPVSKHRDSGSLTPSDDDDARKLSSKPRKSSVTSPVMSKSKVLSDNEKDTKAIIAKAEIEKPKPLPASNPQKVSKPPATESEDDEVFISEKRPLKMAPPTKSIIHTTEQPVKASSEVKIKEDHEVSQVSEEKKVSHQVQAAAVAAVEMKSETVQPSTSKAAATAAIVEDLPTVSWECEHCTFVNEPDTKICAICCKTRVEVLKQLPAEDDDIDISEINDSIQQNEVDARQKGKIRKITFLPGTKAH